MSEMIDTVWPLLPDYIRAAPGSLRPWLQTITATCDPALTAVDALDPLTNRGVSAAQSPATLPSQLLPWLAMLAGLWPDYTGLPEEQVRQVLSAPVDARRRGSTEAIRSAVAATLTGTRTVLVQVAAADPWQITVAVDATEMPDQDTTLAAAMRERPAGSRLVLSSTATAAHGHTIKALADQRSGHTVGALRGVRTGHTHTIRSLTGR